MVVSAHRGACFKVRIEEWNMDSICCVSTGQWVRKAQSLCCDSSYKSSGTHWLISGPKCGSSQVSVTGKPARLETYLSEHHARWQEQSLGFGQWRSYLDTAESSDKRKPMSYKRRHYHCRCRSFRIQPSFIGKRVIARSLFVQEKVWWFSLSCCDG